MNLSALFDLLTCDQVILALFGLSCAAVITAACLAREEREELRFASVAVGINWLLFASFWIYAPLSPAFLVYGSGEAMGLEIPVHHEDMWAIVDLVCMVAVGLRCRFMWWSPLVWGLWFAQLTMLAVAWANSLEYLDYKPMLDASLVIQLLALLALSTLGGNGCADRLLNLWRRFRVRNVGLGSTSVALLEKEA